MRLFPVSEPGGLGSRHLVNPNDNPVDPYSILLPPDEFNGSRSSGVSLAALASGTTRTRLPVSTPGRFECTRGGHRRIPRHPCGTWASGQAGMALCPHHEARQSDGLLVPSAGAVGDHVAAAEHWGDRHHLDIKCPCDAGSVAARRERQTHADDHQKLETRSFGNTPAYWRPPTPNVSLIPGLCDFSYMNDHLPSFLALRHLHGSFFYSLSLLHSMLLCTFVPVTLFTTL